MKRKVVLAPYGVQVLVYEHVEDDRILWFTEEEIEAAAARVRTHKEDAEPPEPLGEWVFKERF